MQSAHMKSDQESAEWNARKAKEAAAEAQQAEEAREKRRDANKENAHERQFLEAHEEVAEERGRRDKEASGHDNAQSESESPSFSAASNANHETRTRDGAAAESSPTAGFDTWLKRAQEQDAQEQRTPEKERTGTPKHDIDVS